MSTLKADPARARKGECSQMACTPVCQTKINSVRDKCANQKYNETDPITGIVATRSFMQKSIQALQLMGPVDCDYAVGYENCEDGCSMSNITGGAGTSWFESNHCISVDPISGQSAPLAAWHSCEDVCRSNFEKLVHGCSGCTDKIFSSFLADAGRKLVRCTTGNHHNCTADLRSGLNSACCAGPSGAMGNGDDTCNIVEGSMTASCSRNPVCAAALQAAGTECPHEFTTDTNMLGLFLDCGGNLQ